MEDGPLFSWHRRIVVESVQAIEVIMHTKKNLLNLRLALLLRGAGPACLESVR